MESLEIEKKNTNKYYELSAHSLRRLCKTFSSRTMQTGAVVRTFVLALPTNVPAFTSRLVIALFDNCVVKCRVENAARTKLSASFNTSLRFMRIASYLHGNEEGWRGQYFI